MTHTAPLDVERLESLMPLETEQSYTVRDTILYALGVGAGASGDDSDLKFVYERDLVAIPSMAVVLAYPGFWQQRPEFGLDWQQILHAEQHVTIHRPIPLEGSVRGITTVERVVDKGAEKGALLYVRREVVGGLDGLPIATIVQGSFLRGNGGFAGEKQSGPRPASIPSRAADASVVSPTSANQAQLYRLSGDYNPLHVDPVVAEQAGLPRPILHGLCTFGIATRAVIGSLVDDEPQRLKSIGVRFTAPVYPGDTLRTEIWQTGPGEAMFRCIVDERDAVVLDSGTVEFE